MCRLERAGLDLGRARSRVRARQVFLEREFLDLERWLEVAGWAWPLSQAVLDSPSRDRKLDQGPTCPKKESH